MTDEEMLVKALENPDYNWRTVEGLTNETGIAPEKIREILRPEVIELPDGTSVELVRMKRLTIQGESLYTTKRTHNQKTGSISKALSDLVDRFHN